MFERILVPLYRSPLAECVLPQAIALFRYLSSQFILFHVLSARQARPAAALACAVLSSPYRHEND
jgi:hypothetical protein